MKAIRTIVLLLCLPALAHAQVSGDETVADTCAHLDEVVVTGVTGSARMREIPAPVNVVSHESLRARQSTNIIDAICRQPGVSQLSTGGGISKPVIRGLGYNRVLVVSDGIRQEGQQWGDEHGVEIDGQAVHSVEILKGPASLMYGSDAMAGVIIMHDAPTMAEGEQYAEAGTEYQTNNGLADYTLSYRGNRNGWVWNGRWSNKWAHDYRNALDGYVPNTRFREDALNAMMGVNKAWGYSHLKVSGYHLVPGMTEIEDDCHEGNRDYSMLAPFQQVHHYKVVSDNTFNLSDGYVKAIVGYQQNRRQEYEEADECGLDFRLQSMNYELRLVAPEWDGWKTNVGVGGMLQRSDNLGDEYLIPAYDLADAGFFATAGKTFAGRLHLSGGARYDWRHLHSLALEEEGEMRFADFRRRFDALSGSVGAIWNVSERMDVKANASHGFRAPNISELGCNGVHEGTFRYEVGNRDLNPERSWQFDLGMDYAADHFSASLALFANHVDDYIYLTRTDESMGLLPVFSFTSADARLLGGEARVIIHLLHHLHFENAFSYVDARQLASAADSRYLPFTPAPRWLSTLHYDWPLTSHTVNGLFVEAEADVNFSQNHVMTANDTETPTPGYTLLNLSAGADVHLPNGRKLCTIGISARNLLDVAYQSHLSRLKYASTYSFTGRYGFHDMGRNVGIKLLFPLQLQ